ncbi:17-beta-hydroxysteroid dehydrogenase 14-like [Eublepharis macularius]|uniref:17-beta-hydroxysteroid dehydrogenase 14-like n=1 Tax=Eublepharis macularius TaxID=481883 RepID=A0AA97LC97_EUBMA|nr:17-beta-hydroxysteroid dehydrogenase 14-like [Eublepharis macularius]
MATCLRYPGKVVIVTGGTSGIGLATVTEFVRQGANVVFCSRACGAERGQEIQRELQNSGCPGDAFYQVCDVRNEADIQRLILVTIERYGCLDCLVNNVGTVEAETIDGVCAQDFRNLAQLNTESCLLTSKYALPYLRKTRGNIVNIASLVGDIGAKNLVLYTMTKGAVIAMTKALAIDESKYGVRVNSLSPGNIWSPMWEKYASLNLDPEAIIQKSACHQLLGRFGTPEEAALGVLFLAADGTFCTGFDLVVSGGAEVGFDTKNRVELHPEPYESGRIQVFSRK